MRQDSDGRHVVKSALHASQLANVRKLAYGKSLSREAYERGYMLLSEFKVRCRLVEACSLGK